MTTQVRSKEQREFLALYNEVHGFLSGELFKKTESDEYKSFNDCINKIDKSNEYPSLKRYLRELELINKFRNFIVHNYGNTYYDIAEPTPYLMEVLENVHDYFVKPVKINNFLVEQGNHIPQSLELDTPLIDVLKLISKHKFSQFPVFHNDEFKGMITDNGLTNFTASEINLNEGGVLFDDYTVKDIIVNTDMDENNRKYSILFQDKELYRVLDQFTNVNHVKNYVLITKSGKNELRDKNDLVGIFTATDIPDIVNRLESRS